MKEPRSDRVSVVIAAFNAAVFLRHAVDSVLLQTPPVLEVLVVDDCSTDDTVNVALAMADMDPRVRVVRVPVNGGPSRARNAGIEAASGDWLMIVDADDAVLPGRVERMLAAAMICDADVVVDNFAWFDPARPDPRRPSGIQESDDVEQVSLARFIAQARPYTGEADWGLLKPMFRKAFLDDRQLRYPLHSRHGEDYLFMIDVLRRGGRYALVHRTGYLYTARSSGFSRTRINYPQMAKDSAALLGDRSLSSDPTVARLIRARVAAIRRLAAEHRVRAQMHDREIVAVLGRSLRDRFVAMELVRFVWRKMKWTFVGS